MAPAQKTQGAGANKRTPQSAFDPAAGADQYNLEAVVGERMEKGVTKYCVKWQGCVTVQPSHAKPRNLSPLSWSNDAARQSPHSAPQ